MRASVSSSLMTDITAEILARFRWVDGHADVWRLFSDADLLRAIVGALSDPFRASLVTKVVGIEARGFVLGGAVATELHAGFVAIRKPGGLLPGVTLVEETLPDYRSQQLPLRLQRESLTRGDHVLVVDDWFETGAQALAAKALIERSGATFVGASVIVDQLNPGVKSSLAPFHALIHREALGSDT